MAETPQTQPVNPPQGTQLRTNHNVRIVTLTTAERVLALFGEIRENNEPAVSYTHLTLPTKA